MQVKERFRRFIRLLTDSKPKGITMRNGRLYATNGKRKNESRQSLNATPSTTLKKRRSIGAPDG